MAAKPRTHDILYDVQYPKLRKRNRIIHKEDYKEVNTISPPGDLLGKKRKLTRVTKIVKWQKALTNIHAATLWMVFLMRYGWPLPHKFLKCS